MSSSPEIRRPWRPEPLSGTGTGRRPAAGRGHEVLPWTAPRWDQGPSTAPPRVPPEEPVESDENLESIYQRAYHEGYREALSSALAEKGTALQALNRVTAALASALEDVTGTAEANLAAVALAVARSLALREMDAEPEILRDLVARGLEQLKPDTPVTVRLSPADHAALAGDLEALSTSETGPIRWLSDREVEPGGFLMETPRRLVDGRIEESLRRIYERIVYE